MLSVVRITASWVVKSSYYTLYCVRSRRLVAHLELSLPNLVHGLPLRTIDYVIDLL